LGNEARLKYSIVRAFRGPAPVFPLETEEPIRSELFSVERLEQHAESLAAAQHVTTKPRAGRRLAGRLRENGRVLHQAYSAIAGAVREERAITPAAEWLIDNFYVAQEQIREIRDDLPRGFYRALPKLAKGALEGYPRVFGIAWAFVAHTDSRFDPEMLRRFVQAYQRVQPLTIGELWAVAITLRIVLVENLRRIADLLVNRRLARDQADALADRVLRSGNWEAEAPDTALRSFGETPLPPAFAVQLVQRLRDQDPATTPALLWLNERLAARGTTADQIVREEHQRLSALNVTVRNVITSMRLISAVDWSEFFESVSLVDAALRDASDFAAMDFSTRDRYRHAIEELAEGSHQSELIVARCAISAAQRAQRTTTAAVGPSGVGDPSDRRDQEPGYYLVSKGRRVVERDLGFQVPIVERLIRAGSAAGILSYVAAIAIIGAFILALPLFALMHAGISGWGLFLLAFLGLAPASDLAVALVNRTFTSGFGPKTLPALALRDGVPASLRTLIVVPTLLTTHAELDEQIQRLEVHYLASQDGDLRFALLSDWTDAATAIVPGDDELLRAATEGIARLNRQYDGTPEGARFFLFHRRRVWNEGQGKWIGWERKRGKLHELNRLLRGATDTTFLAIDGRAPVVPPDVRYVITLDADTRLPRGTAKRLVGKMAHPLNRPRLDPHSCRVVEGYAVLQPRVTPSLPVGREGSLFQRVFTSPSGLDPYAFAVSDVYQDLFGEGSYSGKGIYDIDAFEAALAGRIPESVLLSHDLLEGIFARAGLVSDIEVVEEFPARYAAAAARQHRWARGDWQLLPWIFGRGSDANGGSSQTADPGTTLPRAAIPLIGRWKMLDNLRRTLSAPATYLALLAGWMLPLPAALAWTWFVIATIAIPPLLPAIDGIVPYRLGLSKRRHWHMVGADFALVLSQIVLMLTLLAHQAWLMTDAILRTLYRMLVSRRRLLQWVAAAQAKFNVRLGFRGSYFRMAGGVVLAVAAAAIVGTFRHGSWPLATPFIVLWMLSPAIARWASLPPPLAGADPISAGDALALRLIARRTWRFFETFVTAEDHMLPPDNFQEYPKPVLAHRTSPTNLGLYLLSVVAAHDFGWIGMHEALDRLEASFATINGLERFRGHLYNWYDTQTLRPLDPKYVSSVDSGNWAGHLIALGNGLREMIAAPIAGLQWFSGIDDALEVARESLQALPDDRRTQMVTRKHLYDALEVLSGMIFSALKSAGITHPRAEDESGGEQSTEWQHTAAGIIRPRAAHETEKSLPRAAAAPADFARWLKELELQADTVADIARTLSAERGDDAGTELLACVEAIRASIQSHRRDFDQLMPWASLFAATSPIPAPIPAATHAGASTMIEAANPAPSDFQIPVLQSIFDSIPTVADLPNRCAAAILILTQRRTELSVPTGANGISLAPQFDGLDSPRDARSNQQDSHDGQQESRETLRINTDLPDDLRKNLIAALERSASAARLLRERLERLGDLTKKMFVATDFRFLFDTGRQLLSIGYQVNEGTLDPNCYDLLASEARLASFVAIAKGDLPARHWFHLGRMLTPVDSGSALLSWSGSMFEYLMPSLVMRAPVGSPLEQTSRMVVRRQMEYGDELGLPWGVSESAFNVQNKDLTYQYSSFGVPGLGLKRGLSDNAVVAPYATGLAAMVDAHAAAHNFTRLAAAGSRGRYGPYEALDYTPARVPEGDQVAVVRAYMAHHQGMIVIAIANTLHDGAMRTRFHAEPIIQATELLLQERTPREVEAAQPRAEEVKAAANIRELVPSMPRRFQSPHQSFPRAHLLSNGSYAVMITAAGSGYSRWRDLAVTRWREDATSDCWGSYIFLRDSQSGEVWSAGYQPSGTEPDSYEASFQEDRAEITRRDGTITTTLKIVVSPEDDAEVRLVSISNLGSRAREIEVTSYMEIVLAPDAADTAHPAFSNLFVQTEFIADLGAVLAHRRRCAPTEPEIWAAHLAVVEGEVVGGAQFETDRARFLGRGRGARTPISVIDGRSLSDTVGNVLDPIFSLRRRIRLAPGATARIAFWTLVAGSRSAALDLADRHHDPAAFERAATLAWTHAQVQLFHLGIDPEEADLFQRLASRVIYSNPALRPSSEVLSRSEGGPSALWAHGISGDLPIVICRIDEIEDLEIARQLIRAHEYWRMKQLAVDLVILNERPASYFQDLQNALEGLDRAHQARSPVAEESARGAVFILPAELVPPETLSLLQSVARATLFSGRGSLFKQIQRLEESEAAGKPPPKRAQTMGSPKAILPRLELEFFNGLGGFAEGGREYVTILGEGQWTPAPWLNVIANPSLGFQVSVEGGGYTWSINSQQNQLTPWSNDPVGDRPGEAIYLRDEESGTVWGPTALPIREETSPYIVRHGQGYSRFEHTAHGIALELLQYVPLDDPIKISRLKIRNLSGRTRRLSMTAYVEWVLGVSRAASAPFVVTEIDADTGAMLARNHWSTGFGSRVAFADLAGRQLTWTGDRTEFLGRNGTLDHPAAMEGATRLSNRVGGGLDPCGALQTRIELGPNGSAEIVFFLGEAATKAEANALIKRYRTTNLDAVLHAVVRFWDDTLGAITVRTPDRAMDVLLNRWLLYQTLACRVWARSAFYQASGAYGFRDQIQDVMALSASKPDVTREHLLRAAARQFVEGDFQHWWLAETGQGVRTRISDDPLWLPYAVAHYIEVTGDRAILDEVMPFLEGPALGADQQEAFFEPAVSKERGTLFEHCARALGRCLAVGSHGLPLIGAGDWNDGMNRVGAGGKGESIWLGWFLCGTLAAFSPLADGRGEVARTAAWQQHAATLREALEREGWDGDWYRRAYFDDGTALGSASNSECRIDSIAQSWAVLSGAGNKARSVTAMAAVEKYLVRRDDGLLLLFSPPFERTQLDPGYIKGYPPGVRENGGQYTHGALWSVLAFAMLGDGDKASELLALLNPINHASTRAAIHRYKVEPYVACADVYAEPKHIGRGGWTWYTGSAGWMYRAGLEWILGFRLRGASLLLDPCVPKAWRNFEITFRYHSARYDIAVENPHGVSRGVARVEIDGKPLAQNLTQIPLADDGIVHRVRVVLGVPALSLNDAVEAVSSVVQGDK